MGYTFGPKGVVKRLQSFLLQINVAEIVLHKADEPNTFFDFFKANCLTSKYRTEINLFAV